MRPGEVLDAQRDLLDKLEYNGLFQAHQAVAATYILGLTANARFQVAEMKRGNLEPTEAVTGGKAWVRAMTNHVKAAYAYRVTPDMCTMLEHAASALDESDTFNRDLAPTGCGMVRFERPIKVLDARGKTMLVHWAIWGPAMVDSNTSGLAWSFFNDGWTEPDTNYSDYQEWLKTTQGGKDKDSKETYELAMRTIGRWMSVHQTAIRDGESLGAPTVAASLTQQAQIVATGGTPTEATNLMRYMHALFLLLNQTIVETEDEFPDRHARKRAVKAGLPPKVTVIRLRRTHEANRREGESLVEWSHRWIVRQHWRWQPYGKRRADHKHQYGPAVVEQGALTRYCNHPECTNHVTRIIIPAAVKGPEDVPLIVSDKLYQLER